MQKFAAILRAVRPVTIDGLLIGGVASLAYGAWLAYPPAGFILGGVVAIVSAFLLARAT